MQTLYTGAGKSLVDKIVTETFIVIIKLIISNSIYKSTRKIHFWQYKTYHQPPLSTDGRKYLFTARHAVGLFVCSSFPQNGPI